MNINRAIAENDKDRLARWRGNYVTERERRYVKHVRQCQQNGFAATPHQLQFAADVEAVLRRRGEVT